MAPCAAARLKVAWAVPAASRALVVSVHPGLVATVTRVVSLLQHDAADVRIAAVQTVRAHHFKVVRRASTF